MTMNQFLDNYKDNSKLEIENKDLKIYGTMLKSLI